MATDKVKGFGILKFNFLKEMNIQANYQSITDVSLIFASTHLTNGTGNDIEGYLKSNNGKYEYKLVGKFNSREQHFEIEILKIKKK